MNWNQPKNFVKILDLEKKSVQSNEVPSDEEELEQQTNNQEVKKIVLSGLVKKMKYVVMYNTRQLILYSNKTLYYYNPKNSVLKGKIPLDKTCKAWVKDDSIFILSRPEREYTFKSIDISAQKWVETLQPFFR